VHGQLPLLPAVLVLGRRKLTTIPDEEWQAVVDEAPKFWDEIAAKSPRSARIVKIFKEYNAVMAKAGPPYRAG
jgi:hypothetical protein